MGFADLFKSTKEREREARREKRRAERQVERGLENMGERIKKLMQDRDKVWAKAREYLQAGRKLDAQRLLNQYKHLGVLINSLDRKQMFLQGKLNTLAMAGDAISITESLKGFGKLLKVDPEEIADNIEDIEEVEGEIGEVDKIFDKAADRDDAKIAEEAAKQGEMAVDDDLMAALEREAAADVLGGKVTEEAKSADDINAGRDRLRALLNEK